MKEIKVSTVKRLTVSAMLLAAGVLLPQLFHVFGNSAGAVFLPMHIPVLLCGMLCGWQWGGAVGIIVPILSGAVTGMPVLFPTGISMAGELCAYGAVSGLLRRRCKTGKPAADIYIALVGAMLAGRAVSGLLKALLLSGTANPLTLQAFVASAFVVALPGIAIQLVLVPLLTAVLEKRIKL